MEKKRKKKAEEEPRKLLCSRGQILSPRPAPKLDKYGQPIGVDADEGPYEDDD